MTLYNFDKQYRENENFILAGVDEAGCGPLAGAVYAAAVILPADFEHEYLNDSKKMTENKRNILYDVIIESAIAYCITSVDEKVIDEINILQARLLAMKNAIEGLVRVPDLALIDGNKLPKTNINCEYVKKGDALSANIAAASILAKVSRDRYMLEMAEQYPMYAFHKHMGYPTKVHYERLAAFGPSPIHRLTFLKKLEGGVKVNDSTKRKNTQGKSGGVGKNANTAKGGGSGKKGGAKSAKSSKDKSRKR